MDKVSRYLLISCTFALFVLQAHAAMCGQSEYFEYKFKPVKAGPIKERDRMDAHGRCGLVENRCDLMIFLYGNERCKAGAGRNNGVLLDGKHDQNVVEGREFNPDKTEWLVHSDWELPQAFENPFVVQLCDFDTIFEGRNDQLLHHSRQHLREGCHSYTINDVDTNPDHPWELEFELCCRPIANAGHFRSNERDEVDDRN